MQEGIKIGELGVGKILITIGGHFPNRAADEAGERGLREAGRADARGGVLCLRGRESLAVVAMTLRTAMGFENVFAVFGTGGGSIGGDERI